MVECWMVTVNARKGTEDDSLKSGEWRGVLSGGHYVERRWPKAWNGSPKRRPKQALREDTVYTSKVVMVEENEAREEQVKKGPSLEPVGASLAIGF
jgi:hypothetical protein